MVHPSLSSFSCARWITCNTRIIVYIGFIFIKKVIGNINRKCGINSNNLITYNYISDISVMVISNYSNCRYNNSPTADCKDELIVQTKQVEFKVSIKQSHQKMAMRLDVWNNWAGFNLVHSLTWKKKSCVITYINHICSINVWTVLSGLIFQKNIYMT